MTASPIGPRTISLGLELIGDQICIIPLFHPRNDSILSTLCLSSLDKLLAQHTASNHRHQVDGSKQKAKVVDPPDICQSDWQGQGLVKHRRSTTCRLGPKVVQHRLPTNATVIATSEDSSFAPEDNGIKPDEGETIRTCRQQFCQ